MLPRQDDRRTLPSFALLRRFRRFVPKRRTGLSVLDLIGVLGVRTLRVHDRVTVNGVNVHTQVDQGHRPLLPIATARSDLFRRFSLNDVRQILTLLCRSDTRFVRHLPCYVTVLTGGSRLSLLHGNSNVCPVEVFRRMVFVGSNAHERFRLVRSYHRPELLCRVLLQRHLPFRVFVDRVFFCFLGSSCFFVWVSNTGMRGGVREVGVFLWGERFFGCFYCFYESEVSGRVVSEVRGWERRNEASCCGEEGGKKVLHCTPPSTRITHEKQGQRRHRCNRCFDVRRKRLPLLINKLLPNRQQGSYTKSFPKATNLRPRRAKWKDLQGNLKRDKGRHNEEYERVSESRHLRRHLPFESYHAHCPGQ